MKEHLTKNLELCQFQVISILEIWSMLPSVQVRLYFHIPVFLLSYFLSPYSLPSLQTYYKLSSLSIFLSRTFSVVLRWCFFYHNLIFLISLCIFWHPPERSYFASRICNVYQIVFSSVLLLVFFALVPL